MTRHKGHYRGPQFSYENPPPSREAAQKRLDELGTLIERIKTDLQFITPDDYHSDQDYEDWKNRAGAALAHLRREFKFVDKWLRPGPSGQKQEVIEALIRAITDRAVTLAHDVDQEFSLSETPTPPRDIAQALERLLTLRHAMQRIERSYSELRKLGTDQLSKERLSGLRAPILEMSERIVGEIRTLKHFVHVQEQGLTSSNWQAVCVEALKRATGHGFKLTPVEEEVLGRLSTYVESYQGKSSK